jgi:hypothetical protein
LTRTIRAINENFRKPENDAEEDAIAKWEEDREKKGLPVLDIERVALPAQAFLPEKVNLKEREQVTAWAQQIYDEISKIKTDLGEF